MGGVAILDLSKVLMANYYYNVFNRFWRCTLAYTDTWGFQLKLDTETFEEDILELGISQYFDFSNMDKDALVKEGNVYDRLLKQEKKDICTLVRKGQRGMTLREIYEYMDLDKIDVIHVEMDENDANNVLELTKEYIRKIDERDLELKRIIEENEYNTKKTKKQNGLMKNETDWHPIQEIVCLASKCILVNEGNEMKQKMTAKGVKSSLHKHLYHILYKRVAGVLEEEDMQEMEKIRQKLMNEMEFDNDTMIKGNQKTIQSDKNHQLYTLEMSKILLNNFNDKRYDDNYAYGHWRTRSN